MNRRRIIISIVVLAIAAGFTCFLPFRRPPEPEPVYDGKTLSTWLTNYGSAAFTKIATNASRPGGYAFLTIGDQTDIAIRAMGTNAIPHLLRILAAHDSPLKLKLVELASHQNLVKIHFVPASARKQSVLQAFHALGVQGRPAVPGIIDIYEHGPDPFTRSSAAFALAEFGPAASNVVPALIHGATNAGEVAGVRGSSMLSLRQIGGDAMVVPILVQMLKEPSGPGPFGAVGMLYQCDAEAARPAVPALFELLKTINRDPKKFRGYDMPGSQGGLNGISIKICRLIRQIDPETAAARKSEIDATLKSGEEP